MGVEGMFALILKIEIKYFIHHTTLTNTKFFFFF